MSSWGSQQHDNDSVAHQEQVESEAQVLKEDVCVALVKLTLEILFLVLSQIVSSCFPFNCLLSALHVPFLSYFSSFAFHLCPFPPLPPRCTEAAPTGGRQTPFPFLLLPGGPRPLGPERKGRFLLSFINLLVSPATLRVILCHTWQKAAGHRWHCDICRPQEGWCVLGGAASKSWGVWFVCLRNLGLESDRNLESFKCCRVLFYFLLL